MALVAIPLMVIAAVATHFTARTSVARQRGLPDGAQQAAIMNTLALWVFRSACSSAGASCRWRILVYWLSSNVWTLAQQRYVHRLLDRHDAAGVARAINAPPRPVVDPPEDRR